VIAVCRPTSSRRFAHGWLQVFVGSPNRRAPPPPRREPRRRRRDSRSATSRGIHDKAVHDTTRSTRQAVNRKIVFTGSHKLENKGRYGNDESFASIEDAEQVPAVLRHSRAGTRASLMTGLCCREMRSRPGFTMDQGAVAVAVARRVAFTRGSVFCARRRRAPAGLRARPGRRDPAPVQRRGPGGASQLGNTRSGTDLSRGSRAVTGR